MKIHPRQPSEDLAAELEAAAARKGVSKSEVLRDAVKSFLRRGAGAPADRRAADAAPEAEPAPVPQGPPLNLAEDLEEGAEDPSAHVAPTDHLGG